VSSIKNRGREVGIILFFLLITFPAYRALLHPGIYTSHDLEGHIIRLVDFHQALKDGQFPVRWAKRLNWGLGYPFFNFNYPGVYYLAVSLIYLGLNYGSAFKLLFLLTFPLSGYFTYLWLSRHFSRLPAIAGGLFYTYIPYHFLNVYVRGNIGEALALTLVPAILYSAGRKFPVTLLLSMLILAHNLTAMVFLPVIIIYILAIRKQQILPLIMAVLLTAFFWIPALFDLHYVSIYKTFSQYYPEHFATLKQLIYSPWGFGFSNVGASRGEMSFQIGLPQILIFISTVFLILISIIHRQKIPLLPLFFMISTCLSVFLMLKISLPVWHLIPPLHLLQFPWRLLGLVSLSVSFLAAWVVSRIPLPRLSVILFTLLLLYANRNHWRVNQYLEIPGSWLAETSIPSTTTPDAEHTPVWQSADTSVTSRFIAPDSSVVTQTSWKTNYHSFLISSSSGGVFIDRTVYFPGWTAYLDRQKIPLLNPRLPQNQGLLAVNIPSGSHLLEFRLLEPPIHRLANLVSLLTIIIFLILFLRSSPIVQKHLL